MTIAVPGLPPLDWTGVPGQATWAGDAAPGGALTLTAAGGTDWTNDALGGPQQHRAAALAFTATGDLALSARVRVPGERTTFDAGALAVWGDRDHWAKICSEYSPQGEPMVVSVVTNGHSDDANATFLTGDAVFLRVVRTGAGWAFHSSPDGRVWTFVRLFRLVFDGPVRVGFLAQAPTGPSCAAVFDRIVLSGSVPGDLRDGS